MLTLMTWNVENLFLPGSPSGPKTQQIYDAKLAGLADEPRDVPNAR